MYADMSVFDSHKKLVPHIIFVNREGLLSISFYILYNKTMPSYTTVENVLDLYPRVGSLSTVTSSNIAFYIDQAENEINGHLINGYTLPFSSTPPIISTLSTEYSLVKILQRFFTQEVGSDNVYVTQRLDDVKEYLNKINTGDIGLYTSSLELIPYNPGDTIFSNTMNFDPTFTMIDETYQVIDSERMDQELDAVDDQDYDPSLY
tara:strand:- start:361 stop:975 length:615 start_codon:yes stop_codon:yes gene_type:complete